MLNYVNFCGGVGRGLTGCFFAVYLLQMTSHWEHNSFRRLPTQIRSRQSTCTPSHTGYCMWHRWCHRRAAGFLDTHRQEDRARKPRRVTCGCSCGKRKRSWMPQQHNKMPQTKFRGNNSALTQFNQSGPLRQMFLFIKHVTTDSWSNIQGSIPLPIILCR